MRLIDADALYEKTAEWEAQALHMVEVTMNDEDKTEWRKWSAVLNERSSFKFDIADAPTIEPERWIPCSERLPGNKTYVLTTIYVPGRQPHARSGWYEDGLFMNDNGDIWKATDREVLAWMPLPEPWKGEEHERSQRN